MDTTDTYTTVAEGLEETARQLEAEARHLRSMASLVRRTVRASSPRLASDLIEG